MSPMATTKENMKNLQDVETIFTVEDIVIITRTKHGYWHSYQKSDVNIHLVTLTSISTIPGLHRKYFV